MMKIKALYSAKVIHSDGSYDEYNSMPNIITNAGLNAIAESGDPNGSTFSYKFQVGTGTTPPTAEDTSLGRVIATSGSIPGSAEAFESHDTTTFTNAWTWTRSFGFGQVVGNITEIGMQNGNFALVSRALTVDDMGNPIAISVTADDQLVITYKLMVTVNRSFSYILNVDGTNHEILFEVSGTGSIPNMSLHSLPMYVVKYTNSFESRTVDAAYGAFAGFPWPVPDNTPTPVTSVAFSKVDSSAPTQIGRSSSRMRFVLDQGNDPSGIGWFAVRTSALGNIPANTRFFGCRITPPIVKNNTQLFDIDLVVDVGNVT